MSQLRPIYWRQGAFLEPQHFQLMELRSMDAVSFAMGLQLPFPWGLADLEISQEALLNRVFEVTKLDLWLADGRRLCRPGNLEIAPRSFAQSWANSDEPLTVSLAIPIFSRVSANVNQGELGQGFRRRLFEASPTPDIVPDLLGDGPASQVETLSYYAYILFGSETTQTKESVTLLPLTRLLNEGDKVAIHREHAPPSVRLYDEHPLRRLMVDVLEILKAKSRQLEEYKFNPAGPLENFGGRAMALITVLGVVSRHIARLHYLLIPQNLHPYQAFVALRELTAELTIFSPGLSALGESLTGSGGLRPYDHLDPYPSFSDTKLIIKRLLEAVAVGPELTLVFRREGPRFVVDLPPLSENYLFWLSARSAEPRDKLAASLIAMGKIASPERVESLVTFNLPGVGLSLLDSPPLGLPRNADTVYFSLRQNDPMWREALKARRLTLFWDQAPESTMLTLSGNRL
ncbi:MAG: type VI secretion system baseplate subunit TssK [Deltaproteobacteria bacterium]|jgi:type VI secretion system protein ImpJ|nr:type VI secretion system baseplate subunit TssK [Deltaproteobacteria bacterium]